MLYLQFKLMLCLSMLVFVAYICLCGVVLLVQVTASVRIQLGFSLPEWMIADSSPRQAKPKTIKLIFVAFPLNVQH